MTLRRKLADVGEGQPIETVVGRGYRLREEL
jgi:DNA-binding winged helix-turn-helix (wHTH) protein